MRGFLTVSVILVAIISACAVTSARAESLGQLLDQVLKTHDRILKAQADVDTDRQKAIAALGGWFPELKTTASHGYQAVMNPHADNTRLPFTDVDLKLTQRLWDFGATDATVEAARLKLAKSKLKLAKVRSKLIREAAGIYVGVEGSNAFLKFSNLLISAVRDKIRFQRHKYAIEKDVSPDARRATVPNVETPSEFTAKTTDESPFNLEKDGFEPDVGDRFTLSPNDSPDSVKIWDELTKAQKKEETDKLRVAEFMHGFRTFFGFKPNPDKLRPAPLLLDRMPVSIDEAVQQALESNVDIALAKLAETQARKDVDKARSKEFLPTIDGILQRKWKNNVDGITDLKTDTVAKVELNWPFNLGMTAVNTLKAAKSGVSSAAHDLADTRLSVEEKVRDAWTKIETNRRIMEITQEQISIREYLLQQAEEKTKAHGSADGPDRLATNLDIINYKKQIYEANRDYVKASYDVYIATYKLLELTGQLSENIFLLTHAAARTSGLEPTRASNPSRTVYSPSGPGTADRSRYREPPTVTRP